jgi:hypothetical protein
MILSVPFGSGGDDRSKIWTLNASGENPAGSVQLMVGWIPLVEFVIVTLEGNGTGVVGIVLVEGSAKVATTLVGLFTSKAHEPLSLSVVFDDVRGELRAQNPGDVERGPHGQMSE